MNSRKFLSKWINNSLPISNQRIGTRISCTARIISPFKKFTHDISYLAILNITIFIFSQDTKSNAQDLTKIELERNITQCCFQKGDEKLDLMAEPIDLLFDPVTPLSASENTQTKKFLQNLKIYSNVAVSLVDDLSYKNSGSLIYIVILPRDRKKITNIDYARISPAFEKLS